MKWLISCIALNHLSSHWFHPALNLPPPLHMSASSSSLSLLVPTSPTAHPQSAPSWSLASPQVFQSPAPPWHEDPLSPLLAYKSWIPPRPFNSFTLILSCSGFTVIFWVPVSPQSQELSTPPWPFGPNRVTLVLRISVSVLGTFSIGVISVSHTPPPPALSALPPPWLLPW